MASIRGWMLSRYPFSLLVFTFPSLQPFGTFDLVVQVYTKVSPERPFVKENVADIGLSVETRH